MNVNIQTITFKIKSNINHSKSNINDYQDHSKSNSRPFQK